LEQYIDSGFKNTQKIILELFKDDLKNIKLENVKDPKTLLQELTQKKHHIIPEYNLIKTKGKSGNSMFYVDVLIPEGRFKGRGINKKQAEINAAKRAVDRIMAAR